jgi:hypothetical protein
VRGCWRSACNVLAVTCDHGLALGLEELRAAQPRKNPEKARTWREEAMKAGGQEDRGDSKWLLF